MHDWLVAIYKYFAYTKKLYASVWSETGHCCISFSLLAKKIFKLVYTQYDDTWYVRQNCLCLEWLRNFITKPIWKFHTLLFMQGLYNYWRCITSFDSSIGKKETHMFYVVSVTTFSIFLKLLWISTLLVLHKLNRFRPPHVETDWYLCAVIWRLRQVHDVV